MTSKKARVNAFITPNMYNMIDEIIGNNLLGTKKLSKGLVIDLGIFLLANSLQNGESIESLMVNFLKSET